MNQRSFAPSVPLASILAVALLLACEGTLECPVGETACGGRCAALASDAANCGACGFACSSGACQDGACACPPGKTECGGGCVDLATDPAHCGACGTACAPAQVCSAAACAAACASGLETCGRACADLASDRWNCGACGAPCGAGESCDAGTCRTLAVACFATDEVRTVSPDLAWLGPVRPAGDGPVSLALLGETVFAANALSSSVTALPLPELAGTEHVLAGDDLENVAAHAGRLFVSSSGDGNLLVVDPATGAVLDAVPLGATTVNPRGIAFVGDRAYVALYGMDENTAGQEIAVVDFTGVEGCTGPPCGAVVNRIVLADLADAPGLPFPSRVVAWGTKVYATVANLKKGAYGFYTDPAGNGKLAVVDSADADALSTVDLGPGCKNPGGLAVRQGTLWVACGAFETQALVPVDLAGGAPAPGAPVPTPSPTTGAPFVPGSVAFCGGYGYVTDQWSGDLLLFDPAAREPRTGVNVCPLSQAGWAWAADVACAP